MLDTIVHKCVGVGGGMAQGSIYVNIIDTRMCRSNTWIQADGIIKVDILCMCSNKWEL